MKYKMAAVLSMILAAALAACVTTVSVSARAGRPAGDGPIPPAGAVRDGPPGAGGTLTAAGGSPRCLERGQAILSADCLVRVDGDGFYYYRPAEGWGSDAYRFDSTYGTNSEVEIYGDDANAFVGEVGMYQSMGWTKVSEEDGLTVLGQTEALHFSNGETWTCKDEVYIHGRNDQSPVWVVQISWVEEHLAGSPNAGEVEVMRAIARSLTPTDPRTARG